jgi:hypothetical protein
VDLARGGAARYPGVEVRNAGTSSIPLQTVTVTLPAGLRFGAPDNPDYQLTVVQAGGKRPAYPGSLSGDGQTLTFTNVDLAIPTDNSHTIMYICLSADGTAAPGPASAQFTSDRACEHRSAS